MNDVNSGQINPGLHSDHNILNLELNTNKLNRGKYLWKFKLKLLKYQEYVNIVKNAVRTSIIEFKHHGDKGLVWELTKLKIRSATITYYLKKKKEWLAFKSNLENEIEKLQKKLYENNSPTSLENFNSTKHELEQIEISETHNRIFRSKIKWTEGEKNSKFFLSLEKKKYTNKLISQLNVDGKTKKIK